MCVCMHDTCMYVCVFVCACVYVRMCRCLPTYYLSIRLSACLSGCLSVYLSVYLSYSSIYRYVNKGHLITPGMTLSEGGMKLKPHTLCWTAFRVPSEMLTLSTPESINNEISLR